MFVTLTCTRFERSLSPVLDVLHEWLDSWSGIGVLERGMARQGYDLQLTRYANEGWRATFFLTGPEHSMTQATGSAWEPTPWRAVQNAAWEALEKGNVMGPVATRYQYRAAPLRGAPVRFAARPRATG